MRLSRWSGTYSCTSTTLLMMPRSSCMAGWSGAYFHSPSTMNLYCTAGADGERLREALSAICVHCPGSTPPAVWCEQAVQRAYLVHPWRQQLDDGEVLAGALHVLPGRPVVKGPLHLHMLPAMTPCNACSLNHICLIWCSAWALEQGPLNPDVSCALHRTALAEVCCPAWSRCLRHLATPSACFTDYEGTPLHK